MLFKKFKRIINHVFTISLIIIYSKYLVNPELSTPKLETNFINNEKLTGARKIENNFVEINSNNYQKEYQKLLSLSQQCTRKKFKSCNNVPIECLDCSIDNNLNAANCIYGEPITTNCTIKNRTVCVGEKSFELTGICRFCYQTPDYMHICTPMTNCKRDSSIRLAKVNCTVDENVVCIGSRRFYKKVECNWTSGYKWKVSIWLSITLGGFGIDRFYLGHYKEGLGKLFSFGGLGIWTLVDVALIYVGYVGPADGSVYI